MTVPTSRTPDESPENEAWVEEGRRVGERLDDAHLVLILGLDHRQTALAALGIGRAQALRRRVAIGDLLGDAAPLQQLLDNDDHHGLVDCFLYGISINKIARPVAGEGELYVLPSGSEAPRYEEIFTNERWRRLASGFRETGALLAVAAPADAPHVDDVVGFADGIVLVGDAAVPPGNTPILARVNVADVPLASARGVRLDDVSAPSAMPNGADARRQRRVPRVGAFAGLGLAVVLAALGVWLAARPFDRSARPRRSTSTAAGALPTSLDSSVRVDSTVAGAAASAARSLTPANPGDSAEAAAYTVALMTMNTQAGAIWWFQTSGRSLPAATFAPVLVQGAPWFRVLVGAYTSRAQADSLLGALRAKGEVRSGLGDVVNAPYAFLVDSVTPAAVAGLLKYFADRGQPVYALRQADGSARLYAGAFETREQAALFLESIQASGLRPVLVYRIGRVN